MVGLVSDIMYQLSLQTRHTYVYCIKQFMLHIVRDGSQVQ